jgi:hypothetical protein
MRNNQKQGPDKEDGEQYAVKKYYKGLGSDSFQIMLILSRKVNETIVIDGRILVRVIVSRWRRGQTRDSSSERYPAHRLDV